MPLTSAATDVFGIGTLVLVILCSLAGALCLGLVLYFHFKVGRQQQLVLRDFDSPWIVRMVLVGFCVLWSLGELVRLSWLRESNRVVHGLGLKTQANLCRFHVVWSVGFMEPGFLLTVLFLVKGSLQVASTAGRSLNGRVLTLMAVFGSPVFALQLLLAVTGRGGNERGFGGTVPAYFTSSFETVLDEVNTSLVLCNYPLFSVILLGLFSIIFVIYFSLLGVRMLQHVINRKLQMRAYGLVLVVMVLFPLHVVFLGLSVRIHPSRAAHEVLIFLGFLTLLLCATGAMGVLVVLPVADALAVYCIFRKREQSCTVGPIELFGRPLSSVVSDDDDSPHYLARRSLLGGVSSTVTDAGSSRRDASLNSESISKDLTLGPGPGGWLVDIPGSVASLSPPTLPEAPLTFL